MTNPRLRFIPMDELRDFGRADVADAAENRARRTALITFLPDRVAGQHSVLCDPPHNSPPVVRFQLASIAGLILIAALVCL